MFNEVSLIKKKVESDDSYLFPLKTPTSYFPRFLYGLHNISEIKRKESNVDICHVFSPFLYFFPALSFLKKPILYSVLSSDKTTANIAKCQNLARIIVSNNRTSNYLESKGLSNVEVIKPGIIFNRIHADKNDDFIKKNRPFKIILASAPWTGNQIKAKGIITLLRLVKTEDFQLTFVLRGHFEKEIKELIASSDAGGKVDVINRKIDVPELMKQHHAVVLLSEESAIVKSYPHSLIEGLSMGIPVIVSDTIAMSDMVQENGLGEVVKGISPESFSKALTKIKTHYNKYLENISRFDLDVFSPEKFVDSTIKLYEAVLSNTK